MATLSGQTIANTFDSILHVEDDTAGLVATSTDSRVIQDGVGANSALALATDSVRITSTNKLYFNDAGDEEIHSASDGHLEVNSGTTLDMTAPTVDINASTAVTVDGPAVTIADSADGKPVLTVKTTHTTKTSSGELQFLKDAADTEDGEVLGQITFYGEDEGNNNTMFSKIVAEISESDETDEAGKLSFYVAESDGTDTAMTAGLVLEGEHATDGEVDVTIGAGASSTTTIAGDLSMTAGDIKMNGSAGQGIDFSGSQDAADAGSMTSEVLDSYEEGTWTGVVTDGTNPMTMSIDGGYYTKVGNLVTVSGYFTTSSLGSASGNLYLTGLPFTIANNTAANSGGGAGYGEGFEITAGYSVGWTTVLNDTKILISVWDVTTGISYLQASEWTADGGIIISFSYRAA
jgi:hypothetical protein